MHKLKFFTQLVVLGLVTCLGAWFISIPEQAGAQEPNVVHGQLEVDARPPAADGNFHDILVMPVRSAIRESHYKFRGNGHSTSDYDLLDLQIPSTNHRQRFSISNSADQPLVWVRGDGNVGIGTNNPRGQLEVDARPPVADGNYHDILIMPANNKVRDSDYKFRFKGHSTSNYDNLDLQIPSTEHRQRFSISNSADQPLVWVTGGGNVGIGTNNPRGQLEVDARPPVADGNYHDILIMPANNKVRDGDYKFRFKGHSTSNYDNLDLQIPSTEHRQRFSISNSADQSLVWVTGGGNVGIGTSNPQAKLDVAGTIRTDVLTIDGGADLAEPFAINGADNLTPGMVVSIDPENPGQLRLADTAYDRTVAGVVSGAGGVNSGLIMQQKGSIAAGSHPVALTGRVYVWADASQHPIQPGDLLTTSNMPGHAMAVADYQVAQGAVLGKAMTALDEGQGLVLVLVSLQ